MTEQEFISLSGSIRGKLIALARRFNRAAGLSAEAEDIVQDALVTLWLLSVEGYPIRDAEALAVRLTKTRCVERYRRQHLQYEPIEDRQFDGGLSATEATDLMDIQTVRGIVQRELSDSERKLLELRGDSGLSLDEISALTGRPKGSVKVALSVARSKMMKLFKKLN